MATKSKAASRRRNVDSLPVFNLSSGESSPTALMDVSHRLFGDKGGFKLDSGRDALKLSGATHIVEMAKESGGIWAADQGQLWNPRIRPRLLGPDAAVSAVEKMRRELKVLPALPSPFRFEKPRIGGTRLAHKPSKTAKQETRALDVQVTYPITVGGYPIVGGGGDFKFTLGDAGKLVAYSGVWRNAVKAFDAKIVPRSVADEKFRALTQKLKIESFDAYLAYYAAPSFTRQTLLFPVYVYRGVAKFGQRLVPLRQIYVAATELGTPFPAAKEQPTLRRRQAPQYRRRAGGHFHEADRGFVRRSFATATILPFEAGTSWIGESGGLGGSKDNAKGFVDEWSNDGWKINFNWGDGNAWESDWTSNDDDYVDAADFVFYTGHANMNGWVLANTGGDGWLDFSETGTGPGNPGDLWGQNDLEWAVIAACGPLQDKAISAGGGSVFDRWDGAFDGLHALLGYGAITFDNTDEGRKLAQYCKDGNSVIHSWFRAAQEIQPATNGASAPDGPDIWVGAMWVGKEGADPFDDHAWGHGSVSADPRSPTWYTAMWTTC